MNRGFVGDAFTPLYAIVVIALVVIVCSYIFLEFMVVVEDLPGDTNKSVEAGGYVEDALYAFDYLLVFVFFVFVAVALMSAFLIGAHPIFLGVYILFMAVFVCLSTILANLYHEFVSTGLLASVANEFPLVSGLLENAPVVVTVSMVLVGVVMFSRGGGDNRNY